jgi:hypothetical protein
MAEDDIIHRMGKSIARRKFLARIGTGALGAVVAFVALPDQPAEAGPYCCSLCLPPSTGNCCGGRPPYCAWAWDCCSGSTKYRCTETYCNSSDCSGGCGGISCSHISAVGSC